MSFWQLEKHGDQLACILPNGDTLSYARLVDLVKLKMKALPQKRSLCLIRCQNNLATLVNYLACLQLRHCAILLEQSAAENALHQAITSYQPNVVLDSDSIELSHADSIGLSDELAIMLTTSGTTGTAKFVCLSYTALSSNAQSICDFLPIQHTDITPTTLPFSYSFGLSVINTHLSQGGCIWLNNNSVISAEFWQQAEQYSITALYGVPFTFDSLLRVKGLARLPSSMRYFAQAGGVLAINSKRQISDVCQSSKLEFYTMYGQTEATARMAYLAPQRLAAKLDSIGQAIPGGQLFIADEQGLPITQAHTQGELHYKGDNIMLGYAKGLADLTEFESKQVLATGDLGYMDEDGDIYISGRKKRIIKLNGERTNLDEVEQLLAQTKLTEHDYDIAALGKDNLLYCILAGKAELQQLTLDQIQRQIGKVLSFHPRLIQVKAIPHMPRKANGKTDYHSLEALC